MDTLSGGKSGAKANACDDDGVNSPVPDTVICYLYTFLLLVLNVIYCSYVFFLFLLSYCSCVIV